MDDNNSRQQVVDRISQASNILVTVSANPPVDALSAALALTLMLNKLGKRATAVFSGQLPQAIDFLEPGKTFEHNVDSLRDFIIALDKNKADHLRYKVEDDVVRIFITPYRTTITQKDLQFSQGDFNVDFIIALGVEKRTDLDKAITAHGRILHDAAVATINADMQKSTVGTIDWQDGTASSLSEMVASLADTLQPNMLDPQISTALLTGIVAATERFSNQMTSPRVMALAAQLMAAGANQQLIATKLRPVMDRPSGPAMQQSTLRTPIAKQSSGSLDAVVLADGPGKQDSGGSSNSSGSSEPIGEMRIDHAKKKQKQSSPQSPQNFQPKQSSEPSRKKTRQPDTQNAIDAAEEALAEVLPMVPPAAQQTRDMQQALAEETQALADPAKDQNVPVEPKPNPEPFPPVPQPNESLNDDQLIGDGPQDDAPTSPSRPPELPPQPASEPALPAATDAATTDTAPESVPEAINPYDQPKDQDKPKQPQDKSLISYLVEQKPQSDPLPAIKTKPQPTMSAPADTEPVSPLDQAIGEPSAWQDRKIERPLEEPTFGGTLSATAEQALEDAKKRNQDDRNLSILSHGATDNLDNREKPVADAPALPPVGLPPVSMTPPETPEVPGAPEPPEIPPSAPNPAALEQTNVSNNLPLSGTLADIEQAVESKQPQDSILPSSLESVGAPSTGEADARRDVDAALSGAPALDQSQLSAMPTDFEPLPGPPPAPEPAPAPVETPITNPEDIVPMFPPVPSEQPPVADGLPQDLPPAPNLNLPGQPNADGGLPPMPDFSTLPPAPSMGDAPMPTMPPLPPVGEPPVSKEPNLDVPPAPADVALPPPPVNPGQFKIPGQ